MCELTINYTTNFLYLSSEILVQILILSFLLSLPDIGVARYNRFSDI